MATRLEPKLPVWHLKFDKQGKPMNCRNIFKRMIAFILMGTGTVHADSKNLPEPNTASEFTVNVVSIKESSFQGKDAFEVTMPRENYQNQEKEVLTDRANLAWLPMDFHNGIIEVDVAAITASDAPDYSRGFIGVGFRIDSDFRFEGIYLRPANGRADDQVRRNHSVQYFSLPDYGFERLRKEAPEKYESYSDIGLGEWIHMKIKVHDSRAKLYVNRATHPSLVVNDLKLGADHTGGVGFWIESGTRGYFKNLTITNDKK